MQVRFTVWGEPNGKARPRFSRVGNFTKTYTPQKTVAYENLIKMEYGRQCGAVKFGKDEMLDLRVFAYLSIPKSTSNRKRQLMLDGKIRPTKKPDFDNIAKIVGDSLNKIAYHDDAQVVDSMVRKFYSENPRVVITIQTIGGCENE